MLKMEAVVLAARSNLMGNGLTSVIGVPPTLHVLPLVLSSGLKLRF